MTTLEALKGVNSYPVPLRTLEEVAQRRGILLDDECTITVLQSKDYRLACADLLLWLSFAPQVSQGGQSYQFSDEQQLQMRAQANTIYEEYGETEATQKGRFGYKGSKL